MTTTSVRDGLARVRLDATEFPLEAAAQQELIDLLHTYQGGEAHWAIITIQPDHCDRCTHLSQQVMTILGVWPHG